jgi:hypothetical protein
LRHSLWNAFDLIILPTLQRQWGLMGNNSSRSGASGDLFIPLWVRFFKRDLSGLSPYAPEALEGVRTWFFNQKQVPWNQVYEFVEFIGNIQGSLQEEARGFRKLCNIFLENEFSAYRFIGTTLAPITNEAEIVAIETAASMDNSLLAPASKHIDTALKHLSDKQSPDYRNSMKESISAVEAVCKIIAKNDSTTLGPALDAVAARTKLHPKLQEGFKALFGYTNDTHGIRHALKDDGQPEAEDAKFMLVSCSAFVNYLTEKGRKNSLLPN